MMRRMRRKGARLCSILLALVLLLSLMPTQVAFASDADSETTLEVTPPAGATSQFFRVHMGW